MAVPAHPPANGFVSFMRRVYNPLGFGKGYNAILWLIFDGAFLGFTLSRLQYLDFWGIFCNPKSTTGGASPGECYYYTKFDRNRIGIIVHLATILPAALLAVFQFVPVIRHKVLLYHRIAGYVIILLVLMSNGSAIAIGNHTFGGDVVTRTWIGTNAILTTGSLFLALYNIKRLQIEQHRAWMLRAWFYLGTIITIRILVVIMASVATAWGGEAQQYKVLSCDELLFINGGSANRTYSVYPSCDPSNPSQFRPDGLAIVRAEFPLSLSGDGTNVAAAFDTNFGTAGWLALLLHAIGVEIYLRLTPKEAQRLRMVSYERQLERGFKNPGSAGLTVDRLGDAEPWTPSGARRSSEANINEGAPNTVESKAVASPVALSIHSR